MRRGRNTFSTETLELLQFQCKEERRKSFRQDFPFRIDGVAVGTVKQDNRYDTELQEEEIHEIWDRYVKLQPAMNVWDLFSMKLGVYFRMRE